MSMPGGNNYQIHQYSCECGKQYSGSLKKVELFLKLHYKKCNRSATQNNQLGPIIIEATYKSTPIVKGTKNIDSALKTFIGSV